MQCILCKIYFWKVFHMNYNLICTPICIKFLFLQKVGVTPALSHTRQLPPGPVAARPHLSAAPALRRPRPTALSCSPARLHRECTLPPLIEWPEPSRPRGMVVDPAPPPFSPSPSAACMPRPTPPPPPLPHPASASKGVVRHALLLNF
jgi:hypothetical protein